MIVLMQLCILALVSYYQTVDGVDVKITGTAQFDLAGSAFAKYVDQQIGKLRQFRYEGKSCYIQIILFFI